MPEPLKRTVWKRAPNPSSRAELNRLLPEEETRVRAVMRVLYIRLGSWKRVAAELKVNKRSITHVVSATRRITPAFAMRVARLLGESIGDIFSGKFPRQGECPMCGSARSKASDAAMIGYRDRRHPWRLNGP
jgi:hypothetical protein